MSDKTQLPTGQVPDKGQDDKAQQPETARDSIRAAVAEYKEKEAKVKAEEEKKPDKVEPEKKVEPKVEPEKKVEPKVEPEKKVEPKVEEEKKDETKEIEAKDTSQKPKSKIPFGLPKGLRDKFDGADPEIQEFVSKTLKENMDNKANEGRVKNLRDVEQVLAPLMPELSQLNVTPAQFVKRLVDYTYALASPKVQYQAIAQLANDYGIDLTLFGNKGLEPKEVDKDKGQQQPIDNPELVQKLDSIINKFQQFESTRTVDNEKAAVDAINSWAGFDASTQEYKAKPYFPYVRQLMHNLIASGAVPMKDGKIDLDGAYEAACYTHPEIREHMAEEIQRAAAASVLQNQHTQQQQLSRIKNAGSSIKPGAPSGRTQINTNTKVNSKGQPASVRDSLRLAMSQLREAN